MKLRFLVISIILIASTVSKAQLPVHPNAGVGLIWYGEQENLNTRNGVVRVGQIIYMWRDFEPKKDAYNFTSLEANMKAVHDKGMVATLQINGNRHPDYIYKMVPYLKNVVIGGSKDHLDGYGPIMYWHKDYKTRYEKMMIAIAEFIKTSPYRDAILGIRQSFNAIGTEHDYLESKYRDKSLWTLEEGATWGELWPWTTSIVDDYKLWCIDMYIDAFNPKQDVPVFLRASAVSGNDITNEHKQMLEKGELWLFETSTEPQPRSGKEDQYMVFVNYTKTGKTYGLMESWSKAVDNSTGWDWTKTKKPITLQQFNYWSLLCDLHCGATFPAMRPEDVDVSMYRIDYEFAAKYAGYNAAPTQTPGVWIAFREGDYLVGDYTFMLNRKSGDKSLAAFNVDNKKQGLWARTIRTTYPMELDMNETFASSLSNSKDVIVKLCYKDDGDGLIELSLFGQTFKHKRTNTGDWKVLEQKVIITESTPSISIQASNNNLIVHMLEIERGETASQSSCQSINIETDHIEGVAIKPWGTSIIDSASTHQLNVISTPEDYHFSHWSIEKGEAIIADSSSKNTTVIIISDDANIKANFKINTYSISSSIEGNGKLSIEPNQEFYEHGTSLSITATPDLGWVFEKWEGNLADTLSSTIKKTIVEDLEMKAVFRNLTSAHNSTYDESVQIFYNQQLNAIIVKQPLLQEKGVLTITNTTGQILKRVAIHSAEQQIGLKQLSQGIYISTFSNQLGNRKLLRFIVTN